MWPGHDLLTVVAMPDHEALRVFNMAIPAKTGLKIAGLIPTLPIQDTVKATVAAKAAVAHTGCPTPGWTRP